MTDIFTVPQGGEEVGPTEHKYVGLSALKGNDSCFPLVHSAES